MAKKKVGSKLAVDEKDLKKMKSKLGLVYQNVESALGFVKAHAKDKPGAIEDNKKIREKVVKVSQFITEMSGKLGEICKENDNFSLNWLKPENIDSLSKNNVIWTYYQFCSGNDPDFEFESVHATASSIKVAGEHPLGISNDEFKRLDSYMKKVEKKEADEAKKGSADGGASAGGTPVTPAPVVTASAGSVFKVIENNFGGLEREVEKKVEKVDPADSSKTITETEKEKVPSVQDYVNEIDSDIEKEKASSKTSVWGNVKSNVSNFYKKHPVITVAAGGTVAAIVVAAIALGATLPQINRLSVENDELKIYKADVEAENAFFSNLLEDGKITADEIVQLTIIRDKLQMPSQETRDSYKFAYDLNPNYTTEQLAKLFGNVKSITEGSAKEEASSIAGMALGLISMSDALQNNPDELNNTLIEYLSNIYYSIQDSMDGEFEGDLNFLQSLENGLFENEEIADKLGLKVNQNNEIVDGDGNVYSSVFDYIGEFIENKQFNNDFSMMSEFFHNITEDSVISNEEIVQLTMVSEKLQSPSSTSASGDSDPYKDFRGMGFTTEELQQLYSGDVEDIINSAVGEVASDIAESMLTLYDMKEASASENQKYSDFIYELYETIFESKNAFENKKGDLSEGQIAALVGELRVLENSLLSDPAILDKLGLEYDGEKLTDAAGNEYTGVADFVEEYVSQRQSYEELLVEYEQFKQDHQGVGGQDITAAKEYIAKIDAVLDQIIELVRKKAALSDEEVANLTDMFNDLAQKEAEVAEQYGLDINIKDNLNEFFNSYNDLKKDYEEMYQDVKDFIENDLTYADYKFLEEAVENMANFLNELDRLGNEINDTLSQDKISEQDKKDLQALFERIQNTETKLKNGYQDYLGENFGITTDIKDFGNKYQTLLNMYNNLYNNSNAGAQELVDYQALVAAMDAFAEAIDNALSDNYLTDRERASLEASKNDLAAKENTLNEKYGSNTQIGEHLNNVLTKFNTLQSKINELSNKIEELNGSINSLNSSINDLNGQIDRLEELLSRSHTDKEYNELADQLTQALADLAAKTKQYNDEVAKYNDLLKSYNEAIKERDAAKKALEDYEKNNNHTDAEYNALNDKLTKAEKELEDYKNTHQHTDTEYEKLVDERDKAKQELEDYKKSDQYTDAQYLDMLKKYQDAQKQLDDYKKDHKYTNTQYETLKSQLTKAQNDLEAYKSTHTHTNTEYNELQSKLNTANSEIEKLKSEIESLKSQLTEKDSKIGELETKLAELMAGASDNRAFLQELYYQLFGKEPTNMTDEEMQEAIADKLELGYEGGDNGNSEDHNHNKPTLPEYGG